MGRLWIEIPQCIAAYDFEKNDVRQMIDSCRANKMICGICKGGPPGVLGILGEWLFIFRELGSTGNYFRGAREQAHNFGDIGSLAKKQKNK